MKKTRKKTRFLVYFLLIFLLFCSFNPLNQALIAQGAEEKRDVEKELSDSISSQLKELDLSELEAIISSLADGEQGLFGAGSFIEKVKSVLNGDFKIGYDNVLNAILALLFKDIVAFLPIMCAIIAICILSGILTSLKGKNSEVINLACYGVIVLILFASLMQLVFITKNTVFNMKAQMEAVFPVLLTLMSALGATASAAVYQPAVALCCGFVAQLFTSIVLPIFILSISTNFVGNISQNIRLSKLSSFFSSLLKWLVGLVLALFIAFLAVQGITAATFDGVSVRAARYAISHYIPVVGGFLSDGFNLILAGGMLIKNAVGFSAIVLLGATIISPIIKIAVFSLCLKLTAAVIEPICDKRLTEFTFSLSKSLAMLAAVIFVVAFMYFIIVMLIISTANYALSA